MPHAGCVVWVCICDNISEPRKDVEDAGPNGPSRTPVPTGDIICLLQYVADI